MILTEKDFKKGLIDHGLSEDHDVSLALAELALAVHRGRESVITTHSVQEERLLLRLERILRNKMEGN